MKKLWFSKNISKAKLITSLLTLVFLLNIFSFNFIAQAATVDFTFRSDTIDTVEKELDEPLFQLSDIAPGYDGEKDYSTLTVNNLDNMNIDTYMKFNIIDVDNNNNNITSKDVAKVLNLKIWVDGTTGVVYEGKLSGIDSNNTIPLSTIAAKGSTIYKMTIIADGENVGNEYQDTETYFDVKVYAHATRPKPSPSPSEGGSGNGDDRPGKTINNPDTVPHDIGSAISTPIPLVSQPATVDIPTETIPAGGGITDEGEIVIDVGGAPDELVVTKEDAIAELLKEIPKTGLDLFISYTPIILLFGASFVFIFLTRKKGNKKI